MQMSEAAKNASVVTLTLHAKSGAKARIFLNKHLEMWMNQDLEKKSLTAVSTIAFIDDQLRSMRDTLDRMGRKLENFRISNDVIVPEAQISGSYAKLQELETSLLQLNHQKDYVTRLRSYLQNRADYTKLISPEAAGINSPVLSQMISELARIRGEFHAMRDKDVNSNPYYAQLIKAEQTTLATVKENLASIEQFVSSNITALERQRNQLKSNQNTLPAKEQELYDLQRAYNLTNEVNNLLISRRMETEVEKPSSRPDNEILEYSSSGVLVSPTYMIFAK
jgi:uncharacterized protein involved in exopolysaccharide biosynthesis